jgi:hypothetical protein
MQLPSSILKQVPAFYSKILFQSQPPEQIKYVGGNNFGCNHEQFFHVSSAEENWWFNIWKFVWKSVTAMKAAIKIKVRLFLQKIYFKNILKMLKKNN